MYRVYGSQTFNQPDRHEPLERSGYIEVSSFSRALAVACEEMARPHHWDRHRRVGIRRADGKRWIKVFTRPAI